jgi:hypothetical protein
MILLDSLWGQSFLVRVIQASNAVQIILKHHAAEPVQRDPGALELLDQLVILRKGCP